MIYSPLNRFSRVFQRAVLATLAASVLLAQTITTGEVAGTVSDPTGAVVPGAVVALRNLDNGQTRSSNASQSGGYRFTTLPPGNYQLSASSPGLKSDSGSVLVSIGQVANINLVVKPQGSKEIVMVTDSVPLLQSENANISSTYSSRQIQDLPMPGGDTTTPAFTAPGIVVNTGSGYGNFSSYGLPGNSNLFTVNGNDNNDPYLNLNNSGSSNLTLGANEVSEIAVVQNAYSVAYGRQAGAQVNEVTKSGANEFHGNLNWNWNGALLNANDFFKNASGTPRGRANSNQYAASIGGPVIKNKTFFFLDTEGIRYILPSAGFASIPSPQLEAYALAHVQPSQAALYQNAFNLYNSSSGASRAVPVTTGSGPLQDPSGSLGCGDLAGTPTGSGGTFGADTPCASAFGVNTINQNKEWLMVARADQQLNDKQKIFFRFRTDHGQQPTFTSAINPAFNSQSIQPEYEGQVDYTYVISPNIVNQAIGSAMWYSAEFGPASIPASLSAFPTFFNFSGNGGASGSGGAFTPIGFLTNVYPQGRNVAQGQVIDDLSIVRGNHTFRVGGNYRKNQVTDIGPQTLTQGGQYIFGSMADFVTGSLVSGNSLYQQSFTNFAAAHTRFYNLGVYLQDEWAIKSNLKLTLGVRFDRTGDPSCLGGCFSRYNGAWDPTAAYASIPYNQSIASGLTQEFGSIEPVVYQPRIGFVYSPTRKTVIRGGAGIFSDLAPGDLVSSVFENPPNVFTPTVEAGLVSAPIGAAPGTAPATASAANTAFRQGFASGYTLQQIQAITPSTAQFVPPGIFLTPNKIYNPKYAEWSFGIQQELDSKSALSISYVGNHGYDLILENDLLNASNAAGLPGFGFLPATAPDPRFNLVTSVANDGISNYNGMTVQFRRSLGYGFQGQANYTWSHALDDLSSLAGTPYNNSSSFTGVFYPYNKSLNYSNSDFDIRNSFTADFTWETPFKFSNRIVDKVIGGWTMGGKFFARSGMPFSVVESNIGNSITPGGGYNNGFFSATNALLATVTGPVSANCGPSAVNTPCLSASSFSDAGFW